MKRRDFIALLGGSVATWPLAGSLATPALTKEPSKIVILHSGFPERTPIHLLFEALAKLGYENSRTAAIDLMGGEGDANRLNALVAQIGSQKPDVIIAITSPAVVALKEGK